MLYGNSKLYAAARAAKMGKGCLHPGLAELRDWISSEYQVNVVHIVLDQIEIGPVAGHPRLNIILETDKDFYALKTDPLTFRLDVHDKVIARFRKIALGYHDLESDNVLLVLDNFSDECLGKACSRFLKRDARQIADVFKYTIWQIDGFSRLLVVFLYTDDEVKKCTADGTCNRISRQCFKTLKQYDEFNYLTSESFRLRFDSKENLDNNYKGNLFYYWR
ncbi:MAG: hypothetical protein KDA78_05590 [Planctomycetaceae bacterium]|nr:hypothetical protein [Planctomycetaceae bacterium]